MKKVLITLFFLHVLVVSFFSVTSCDTQQTYTFRYETEPEIRELVTGAKPPYPDMNVIVIADTHYLAPELVTEGSALTEYLHQDRKMLLEGPEILDATLKDMQEKEAYHSADFLIVCGDMTKDGEYESHRQVASVLDAFARDHVDVFVVPGNHDIANGESYRYSGDSKQRVANVSPEAYRQIYQNLGYRNAVYNDPASLSYIVEPVSGVWLFAMDSCKYGENVENEHPVTGGAFNQETLVWLEDKLIEALQKDKAVLGVMHHGVLEHYSSNAKYYDDYLLDDFEPVAKMFAAYGMRFVFTGHFHAQDITAKQWISDIPNQFIVDIETGSLVTFPVPWRFINVTDETMDITSHSVSSIESHPDDFSTYAKNYIQEGMTYIIKDKLSEYGVPEQDQDLLVPQIARAYVAHLQGDEQVPPVIIDTTGIGIMGHIALLVQGDLVWGWYHDLGVPDNNVTIDTATGWCSSE